MCSVGGVAALSPELRSDQGLFDLLTLRSFARRIDRNGTDCDSTGGEASEEETVAATCTFVSIRRSVEQRGRFGARILSAHVVPYAICRVVERVRVFLQVCQVIVLARDPFAVFCGLTGFDAHLD